MSERLHRHIQRALMASMGLFVGILLARAIGF